MIVRCLLVLAALLPACSAAAQSYYPRHNFSIGLGLANPGDELKPAFHNSFLLSAAYGYRLHRYFQADIGLDAVFGAARVRDYLPSQFGNLRIRDYQYLVPMGGRVVLPAADGRVLLSGGGGAAYLRYTESLQQPSQYFEFQCDVCTARSGWGYYGLASGSVAIDRSQLFRVGVTAKFYGGHTDGEPLGFIPGIRTRDRWVNITGDFLITF